MRSVGARPERMTRRPSTIGPSSTRLVPTVPSSATVKTILLAWSDAIALSGTSSASRSPPNSRSRPKKPGVSRPSLLSKMARPRMVPVLGLTHVVDEIHPALVLEIGLVGEPDRDRILHVARRRPRSGRGEPQVAQEVRLAAVEHEVNGIDRHDDGQQRRAGLAAGDQIAGIDAPVGDAPGDRRAHLGPFEIELGLLERGLGRGDLAGGVALRRSPGIELPLGHGLAAHQRRRALARRAVAISSLALRALHIGLGLLDRDLVGARIDDEQEVALLDDLAVLEMDGIDEAGDPGAHLDGLHRREAAGVFVPLGDRLLQRARHRDRRRRRPHRRPACRRNRPGPGRQTARGPRESRASSDLPQSRTAGAGRRALCPSSSTLDFGLGPISACRQFVVPMAILVFVGNRRRLTQEGLFPAARSAARRAASWLGKVLDRFASTSSSLQVLSSRARRQHVYHGFVATITLRQFVTGSGRRPRHHDLKGSWRALVRSTSVTGCSSA